MCLTLFCFIFFSGFNIDGLIPQYAVLASDHRNICSHSFRNLLKEIFVIFIGQTSWINLKITVLH